MLLPPCFLVCTRGGCKKHWPLFPTRKEAVENRQGKGSTFTTHFQARSYGICIPYEPCTVWPLPRTQPLGLQADVLLNLMHSPRVPRMMHYDLAAYTNKDILKLKMDEVQGSLQSLDISNCVVTHLASLLSLLSCLQNLQLLSCIANTLMVIALHRIIRITMCMQADTSFNLLVHLECLGWCIMNSLPMPTRTRSCSRYPDEVQGSLQSLDIWNCIVAHSASLLSLLSRMQNLQLLSCITCPPRANRLLHYLLTLLQH